jgi:hypothetical protein
MVKKIIEEFSIGGHENITASHKSTIEFTKDEELTIKGDCIVGICSEKGLSDFDSEFKKLAKSEKAQIICKIIWDNKMEIIKGKGHPKLTFQDPNDIVIRKSNYICDRTLMIKSNKASIDLNDELINKLKIGSTRIKVICEVRI